MLGRLSSTLARLLVYPTATPSHMSDLTAGNLRELEEDVIAVVTGFKLGGSFAAVMLVGFNCSRFVLLLCYLFSFAFYMFSY